jgi:AcrR family transcriptional regulator
VTPARFGRAVVLAGGFLLAATGCRGQKPGGSPDDAVLRQLVDSLRAPVEQATGLTFKTPPRSALRTRDQVRQYLLSKLDEELPPERMRGLETAYRLFGLLPDTLALRGLLLDLYAEQVAGYYDPDSTTLFGVAGADRDQLRLVLAHEMVHALQGQYLPLDSILKATANNDRLTAAQSVLEGQATLASIEVLAPGQHVTELPSFWEMYRDQVREKQTQMPVFARAPLVVREALIFPYLDGAEFMYWWRTSGPKDTLPYGRRMPVSTEQILHPERYARGDRPAELAFTADTGVAYEDVLGENEIRVLLASLAGSDEVQTVVPIGWGGDRFRVYRAPGGPALVWYVVWDDPRSADRFLRTARAALQKTPRRGYRAAVDSLGVGSRPAVRYVLAPDGWNRWGALPGVSLAEAAPAPPAAPASPPPSRPAGRR